MDFKVFEHYDEMCGQIAGEIADCLKQRPALLLCIAAGHTSLGLFEQLIQLHERGDVDFSRAAFVAMDEWLDMSPAIPQSCGDFLNRHFLSKVNFPADRVCLFDATQDAQTECARVERFIEENSAGAAIDYLVLGSGMNGHLALNEPGTDFASGAHVTGLDPVTMTVGQKYFSAGAALTGGMTLGIGNFSKAGRSVLMVSGVHKHDILGRILNDPIDPAIPATAVRQFANASIYCDKFAYDGE